MSLSNKAEKFQPANKSKSAFTRFSMKLFSSVLEALTPCHKKVLQKHGLRSLVMFNKCYIPNKFAKWVASVVDPKSGDVVVDGKIISLTKESVHHVLDLPLGGRAFPSDSSSEKSFDLEKFQKSSILSVNFFANKIINKEEAAQLSEEEFLICFILVALSTFLCPNSSLIPSQKYFGIFDGIGNLEQFDWSGYVLSWLLERIKNFRKGNSQGTLGGCLYYLAVIYLDFVDFGPRRVSDCFPRISVWKEAMISTYSDLDLKSPGCYGFRPILNFSETCYSKILHNFDCRTSSLLDDEKFMDDLNSVSRCKLPDSLKSSICKALEKHSFNYRFSLNLDLSAISSLPDNLLNPFTKLMKHASNVDYCSKQLVLEILKVVTEYDDDSGHKSPILNCSKEIPSNQTDKFSENQTSAYNCFPHVDHMQTVPLHQSTPINSTSCLKKPPSDFPESSHKQLRNSSPQYSPNIVIASSSRIHCD